jgi:hypothetical protein
MIHGMELAISNEEKIIMKGFIVQAESVNGPTA